MYGRFNVDSKFARNLDFFTIYVKIANMKIRYLQQAIEKLAFGDQKMAFVSGPRQCGKTTLGRMLAEGRSVSQYYSWDDIEFRRLWTKSPKSIVPQTSDRPLVILDEIHKDRTWKRTLKGIYDTIRFQDKLCDFFITGSSRLNVYRRGSDSLLGRYYHFRLAPFSLREMQTPHAFSPDVLMDGLKHRSIPAQTENRSNLHSLLHYGPFPEPLFRQNRDKWRLWRQNRHETIIREDLRDISRSTEIGKIELLASILPEKVASPLSINSLREDMEVGHETLRRWLGWLKELYFIFEVKPWHHKIRRSLKKEGKIYLWDYSEIENPGARFENLAAVHLIKACNYWTDTGQGKFELYYLRSRDKLEIDFLIVRDGKPWLPVEVKMGDEDPAKNWRYFLPALDCRLALQITEKPCWKLYSSQDGDILVAGADEALMYFV
jgi:predicted AAA+ superfamily ATPase